MEVDFILTPRPDLAPDWCEVQITVPTDMPLFFEVTFPAGSIIQIENLTLETIEEAMSGSAVMCRIVKDDRHVSHLLSKYMQGPSSNRAARILGWLRWRITRS